MNERRPKTLEDLTFHTNSFEKNETIKEELREEAKKWITYLMMYDMRYAYSFDEAKAKITWIRHFFNIPKKEWESI